ARVSVRNIRRDGMDTLKKMEKDGDISEDRHRTLSEEVQKLTDLYVSKVDDALKAKEAEIMQV
ncbi:MAG TPA: ribosome recycling factor, partial [Hyphomonas sp.]|nr:ribosome recycling factor [Hyphomonas sp.]